MTGHDELGLGALAPIAAEVQAGGETITVSPAGLVTLAQMARELGPLMQALESLGEGDSIAQALLPALMDPAAAESLVRTAAFGSGRPLDWVSALPGDEQLELLIKVVEVNLDFFARRLQPQLISGLQRMVTRLTAGRT